MRLERLEINGFKSFSDRSELAFDKGVTAIVGPNGCGKSNVADAITWVMGEQSAKSLRGDKMEDVIFSGSDARKPTATAEVRLRFSGFLKTVSGPAFPIEQSNGGEDAIGNGRGRGHTSGNGSGHNGHGPHANAHDHGDERLPVVSGLSRTGAEAVIQSVAREIEVTRRLYRSGESEYLIDGQVCRLRDVHDLLMDTGLGAKAYSVIEQGMIGIILSSRSTDRRQLIEEAAGVTKYKARRRSAELKLQAAQVNLTRIDDIAFEVERQRGTLKRQAGKARRYQRLRDELRRWEKVLFARKYRQLAATIASARARLTNAREREAAAAARVGEMDADLGRLRIELVEAESASTESRNAAHARELAITRQEQQLAFDRDQVQALEGRTMTVAAELEGLEVRREPASVMLAGRRDARAEANGERDRAAVTLASESEAYEAAHREIEGLEADVEAARSEVFSSLNSATALGHALEHAAAARDRVAETLSKLDVEVSDVRIESERVAAERGTVVKGLRRAHESIAATCIARSARESELASARIEHEWRARSVRAREHELAGLDARLKSLVELDAARAGYGDAARTVLVQADGKVSPQGAIADYLEVEAGYERAVEACLGDLLEHVVVERPEHAAAGFHLVREAGAGRCGFLVTSAAPTPVVADVHTPMSVSGDVSGAPPSLASTIPLLEGIVALSSVVRVNGPFAGAIRRAVGDAWIARSYDGAALASQLTGLAVATLDGDVFRGPHLVSGGGSAEARGILATKGEIKELRQRIAADREALLRLAQDTAELEATIAHASNAIAALNAEHHRQEKAVVGYDAQLQHAADEEARLAQKSEQLAREKRQAEEERDTLDRRQEEARASIARLEEAQRHADQRLTFAQRRLFEAREAAEDLSHRAADAGAALAALVERASALSSEVQRLEEAALELDERSAALSAELDEAKHRVRELHAAIASGRLQLDADERALDALRQAVMARDDVVGALRTRTDELEASIKDARVALDAIRAVVSEADVARATAEADLSHLGHTCEDAVNATLDDVVAEIDQLEREGHAVPDADVVFAEEPDEDRVDTERSPVVGPADDWRQAAGASAKPAPSAEEAVSALRAKIDRVGPVNMMAIGEFEELEARHTFLTAQRKDLVDSIAQTSEAIERIDETTTARFTEAFSAINENFQHTFSTLFGGGRAGLTLLDENDPLESGIEIVAQPPGKRLQSVQLLSGGEKALTAIALMFGMFKYKPSPFCLLDEIDAPLDDANIGRFVEMLRGMQEHTQFIVITHNRKTMEIADRLYGVTMEEPGVSKLISVQLN
ncbi:MAG: chromosome segregation protein SMC [Acidobacteria bacterium]|nr:MAG: chromosome segregation protein SMC [Acidobacteriota bacterium]